MTQAERIFDRLPEAAQSFIDFALEHPDNYTIDINVNGETKITVLKDGVEEVFKYEESARKEKRRCLTFMHKRHEYWLHGYEGHGIVFVDRWPSQNIVSQYSGNMADGDYTGDDFFKAFRLFMLDETMKKQ